MPTVNGNKIKIPILKDFDDYRDVLQLTREELAEKMNKRWPEDEWTKDKLDHIFLSHHCPHAETLAKIALALGLSFWKPEKFTADGGD